MSPLSRVNDRRPRIRLRPRTICQMGYLASVSGESAGRRAEGTYEGLGQGRGVEEDELGELGAAHRDVRDDEGEHGPKKFDVKGEFPEVEHQNGLETAEGAARVEEGAQRQGEGGDGPLWKELR